jgi:parallel beta-helix repeat protein
MALKQVRTPCLIVLPLISLIFVPLISGQTSGLIFIRGDGSIEGTNKIYREGSIYLFNGDIEGTYGIIVERSNIVIDGRCHTLKSVPRLLPLGSWDFGIELSSEGSGNVTVKNLRILDFNIGVYIWTTGNTVKGNTIMGSNVGVFLAESPNTIVGNYIEDNGEGVFLGPLLDTHPVAYNVLYHNSFVNNTRQVYDCECNDTHTIQHMNIWDNGTSGNYWNDYNGIDADKDGIGDTPHPVTSDDKDNYPLMTPITQPITKNNGFLGTGIPNEIVYLLVSTVTAITVIGIYLRNKRKRN